MDNQEVKRNQILIDFIKTNYLEKIKKLDEVDGLIRDEIKRDDKNNKPIITEKYIVKNEDTNEVEKDENGNPIIMSTHIMYKITKDGEILKIPLWLLDIDDFALLLQAEKHSQLQIIEKMIKSNENLEKMLILL